MKRPQWLRNLIGAIRSDTGKRVLWSLLVVAGTVAIVSFIVHYGPATVWRAFRTALPWLPLFLLAEFGWASADLLVWRLFLGAKRAAAIPLRVWARGSMLAYVVMIILPAGRAGGEVARAVSFARFIGKPAAVAGCIHALGCGLIGNAWISLPCFLVVGATVGWTSPLAALVATNGLLTLGVGAAILISPRRVGFGRIAGKRIAGWVHAGEEFDRQWRRPARLTFFATAASGLGRLVQTGMLALILFALDGTFDFLRCFVAEGIYLVSAGMGDFVPNQIGMTEGVFVLFGPLLELSRAELALSIALIIRTIQFSAAGLCAIGIRVLARPGENHVNNNDNGNGDANGNTNGTSASTPESARSARAT